MTRAWLVVLLVGCGGLNVNAELHVDEVNVNTEINDPTLNVDVGDVDVGDVAVGAPPGPQDAGQDLEQGDPAEQPDAGDAGQPAPAVEPAQRPGDLVDPAPAEQPQDGEPEEPACADADGDAVCDAQDVCPNHADQADADSDGVPDGCDVCPAGSDADADESGYPDGCEDELWAVPLVMPARTLVRYASYRPEKAAVILLTPWSHDDCFLADEGFAYVQIEVPNSATAWTTRIAAPTTSRAGKLIECLNGVANFEFQASAWVLDPTYGPVGLFASSPKQTSSIAGHQIAYIRVVVDSFWASRYDEPNSGNDGTWVEYFSARVSIHGY